MSEGRGAGFPAPPWTFAAGLILGIVAAIGLGTSGDGRSGPLLEQPALRPVTTTSDQRGQPHPSPVSMGAAAGAPQVLLVYYMVASAQQAGSVNLAIGQSAGAWSQGFGEAPNIAYRVIVVETPEQESAALEAIAGARDQLVQVIDLRPGRTPSGLDAVVR